MLNAGGLQYVNVCVCLFTGKRIPVVDAAGGSSGKGFKLGRQASESRRTCCWWRRWLSPRDLWPDLCLPSLPDLLQLTATTLCQTPCRQRHPGEIMEMHFCGSQQQQIIMYRLKFAGKKNSSTEHLQKCLH